MYLIGSLAAYHSNTLPLWRLGAISDMDVIGTPKEMEMLVSLYRESLINIKESDKYKGKFNIKLKEFTIEFDATGNSSNEFFKLLPDNKDISFDTPKGTLPCYYVSLKTNYLLKRSHINYPINWHKNFKDLLAYATILRLPKREFWNTTFEPIHLMLYEALRREAKDRYGHLQDKIKLDKPVEEFFEVSKRHRFLDHDELHNVIAKTTGEPMYRNLLKKEGSALLDKDKFEALSDDAKAALFQEESMVIGIERCWINNPKITEEACYFLGAQKVLFSLSKGWFQDWGLDHIHLLKKPMWPFLERFEKSELYKDFVKKHD